MKILPDLNKNSNSPDIQDREESHDPKKHFSIEPPLIEALLQINANVEWLKHSFDEQINELKQAIQELADSQQQQQQVPIEPPQPSDIQNDS